MLGGYLAYVSLNLGMGTPTTVVPTAVVATVTVQPAGQNGGGDVKAGNLALLTCTIKAVATGLNFDPDAVSALVEAYDGTVTNLAVTKQSAGVYTALATFAKPPTALVRFFNVGTVPFLAEATVIVEPKGF